MSSSSDDKRPTRVLEHLFIGSRVHAKNRALLQELGINRILNVTPPRTMDPTNGVPSFFEKDRSMTYKRVAVFDNRGEDLLQHFESCISFIEQGSFYGRVLVHCNKGVSRSSTVVAAYLMSTRGLSKDAAMAYLVARRPIVNPHEGFMAQLKAFEEKLRRERDAAIADGQEKKFPDDLLADSKTRKTAPGASIGPIGPIGPPRGPSGPSSAPRNAKRNTSPMRGPSRGPTAMVGPLGPPVSNTAKKGSVEKGAVGKGVSRSPPRSRHGGVGRGGGGGEDGGGGGPIGPSRRPLSLPSVDDARGAGKEEGEENARTPLMATAAAAAAAAAADADAAAAPVASVAKGKGEGRNSEGVPGVTTSAAAGKGGGAGGKGDGHHRRPTRR